MLFVDGENLTIRAQTYLAGLGCSLKNGDSYRKDVFLWLPGLPGSYNLANPTFPLQSHAARAYYYTSLVGDPDARRSVEDALKSLGFTPRVFARPRGQAKAKGVDISLATDLLGHAFRDHLDAAVLVAGDGDYVPLVEEVKRTGKHVYVAFLETHGLSPGLKLAADEFFGMEWILKDVFAKK
jgi:hypothetical protein